MRIFIVFLLLYDVSVPAIRYCGRDTPRKKRLD